MAFRINAHHDVPHVVLTVASLTARKGSLLTNTAAAECPSLMTTDDGTVPGLFIADHAIASTDTEASFSCLAPNMEIEADISEILNKTALTATGGSGTTFVDDSLCGIPNDALIGGTIKVLTMASGDSDIGDVLPITDFNGTTGTITFASVGSTGFAAGDTAQLLTVGQRMIGCWQIGIDGTYADSLVLDQGSAGDGGGDFFRVTRVDPSGKFVIGFIRSNANSQSVLTTA